MTTHSPAIIRRMTTVLLVSALTLGMVLAAAPASTSRPSGATDKIEAGLRERAAANGSATFWALLKDRADLSAASSIRDWTARGEFVVDRLRSTAEASQAGLLALLRQRGADHRPFFIVNAVRITGGAGLLAEIAARPEIERLVAARTFHIPELSPREAARQAQAVEWGISNIRADDVWSDFGARGAGIVVANIDTGVLYTHPAVVEQYRGKRASGSFRHDYNWWDPSEVCGNPSLAPCDNNGHGTHTMGTMVGDDGATNQVGVAPKARWIAAKGCETSSCSDFALLSSAQWILAPTRLNGSAPRARLRPHVVNNSWAGGGGDPWYMDSVDAWVASGIFPAFALGNSGSSCDTAQSPGDYAQSYGAGAYDVNNTIAAFSSRGPSDFSNIVKPNISAPGVNVRSSWNNGGYVAISGTSMASPHVAGTVALIWSAAPSMARDIAATRGVLDTTAVDKSGSCGGDLANNNTYGQGRLDAYAAVNAANN
jgi:hypothetical protein